jgi:hypothetical protein
VPAIALGLLILLLTAPPAGAGSWQRPVDGAVLRPFALSADRYARGQHRGVDLRAAPGELIRSTCAGRVSFAGRVPRGGLTVSVRCGALVATYQQLGRIAVRAGRHVARGASLGATGRSGDPRDRRPHVHFGVREARSGRYLDPLTFLRGPPASPLPPAVAPPRRADPPLALPRPVAAPAHRPAPMPWTPREPLARPRGAPARVPWAPVAGRYGLLARAPLAPAAGRHGLLARAPLAPAAGRHGLLTRAPLAPAAAPRPAPPLRRVPSSATPGSLGARPAGTPGPALPHAAGIGGSPSRMAPAGPRYGTNPSPGASSDPEQYDDAPSYVAPEIPWYVWLGVVCVALALPIGGLIAVREQRRRAARRAAATAR